MPQFNFATFLPQIFWLLICFGFLYFCVSRIIAPRILSIVNARDNKINRKLNSADRLQLKIDKLKIKSEKLRKRSTALYSQTIKNAVDEAILNREKSLNQVKFDIDKMTANAEKSIQNSIENSTAQYQEAAKDIAVILSKKIFGENAKFNKEVLVPINKFRG